MLTFVAIFCFILTACNGNDEPICPKEISYDYLSYNDRQELQKILSKNCPKAHDFSYDYLSYTDRVCLGKFVREMCPKTQQLTADYLSFKDPRGSEKFIQKNVKNRNKEDDYSFYSFEDLSPELPVMTEKLKEISSPDNYRNTNKFGYDNLSTRERLCLDKFVKKNCQNNLELAYDYYNNRQDLGNFIKKNCPNSVRLSYDYFYGRDLKKLIKQNCPNKNGFSYDYLSYNDRQNGGNFIQKISGIKVQNRQEDDDSDYEPYSQNYYDDINNLLKIVENSYFPNIKDQKTPNNKKYNITPTPLPGYNDVRNDKLLQNVDNSDDTYFMG